MTVLVVITRQLPTTTTDDYQPSAALCLTLCPALHLALRPALCPAIILFIFRLRHLLPRNVSGATSIEYRGGR